MEIYKHCYEGYGSVEAKFQARFGKKAPVQPRSLPVSQEEMDKIKEDPDLLKGIENHIPNIIKTIK
ncbi:hypothetical protein A2363_02950 [Candidatus Gottesmanbacteria bacterium RIFOXYB1_FULL_47_11]|uniref:Uncharacterized protein n=1 Tax=Candidatus Gottesmanbacteria bacterium RIFOXYB1_FULL_47_11 TaxID=1798401 RepID=A0A1F6BDN0_9BACT|nr:MAG: hypothetical protein A2363_02950 [Candidatus Gottesmanbacteria bacterium RIFOXYB1_FULL_47_11]